MPLRRSAPAHQLPEGFKLLDDFLDREAESELLAQISALAFKAFEFQGYTAKRRIVEFGLEYSFTTRQAHGTNALPGYFEPMRARAAQFAGVSPNDIAEAIVTEYPPQAPMGWHRDVPQFETIIGISLGSACWMRFKPYRSPGKVLSVSLEPRSIYVMSGAARWKFQHSIVPVESLRYSITLRTLRHPSSAQ